MTRAPTIEAFVDALNRALMLSGRGRRRVIDEARDHLIEARDRGISAGLDLQAAEIAAIEAFGDPAAVACSSPDCRDHPGAGTDGSGDGSVVVTLGGAGLPACVGDIRMDWNATPGAPGAGLSAPPVGWKQEHPTAYQIATNAAGLLGGAAYFPLELLAGSRHPTPWLFITLAPLLPVSWILNSPRRYQSPAAPAA